MLGGRIDNKLNWGRFLLDIKKKKYYYEYKEELEQESREVVGSQSLEVFRM